jgi:hypothetical protein
MKSAKAKREIRFMSYPWVSEQKQSHHSEKPIPEHEKIWISEKRQKKLGRFPEKLTLYNGSPIVD